MGLLPTGYSLSSQLTEADLQQLFSLRWEVLRKPWRQPKGTEQDDLDSCCYHVLIRDEANIPVASGRLQENEDGTFQVRYMAVLDRVQGRGLGRSVLSALENEALRCGARKIILQARELSVPFYEKCGFRITEKTFLLYGSIQHYLMEKNFENM